ncbi:hypothetical protein ACTU44_21715 (plasmid) [Thalassospira sp. SM2505]
MKKIKQPKDFVDPVSEGELAYIATTLNHGIEAGQQNNLSALAAVGRDTVSRWFDDPSKIRPHMARLLRALYHSYTMADDAPYRTAFMQFLENTAKTIPIPQPPTTEGNDD